MKKFTDDDDTDDDDGRRTHSDAKSSHGLWPGELKSLKGFYVESSMIQKVYNNIGFFLHLKTFIDVSCKKEA